MNRRITCASDNLKITRWSTADILRSLTRAQMASSIKPTLVARRHSRNAACEDSRYAFTRKAHWVRTTFPILLSLYQILRQVSRFFLPNGILNL